MKTESPKTIYLSEYQVPDFLISTVNLRFDLFEEEAIVSSKIKITRNPQSKQKAAALVLDGEHLELRSVKINGQELPKSAYTLTDRDLKVQEVPDDFTLECITKFEPQKNLSFEGLYKSGKIFCTQCEAQGFRRITYFLDRPDVMAVYTVEITADQTKYPILLSNGNKMESKKLENNRHYVKWNDPFKKPSYLFALVGGDLDSVVDSFTTKSGRKVHLEIFVDKGNANRTAHAMSSLQKSMKWDEEVFGLEYDLDIFMIVAVNDFNMGAMENKGLNIFNASLLLANPATATDLDYQAIEAVIAHEYFHNWTGDRVTCRDWFQLSLKEGLTVYRDQEFSADMSSRPVRRIDDVKALRSRQFMEDAGPMAHPVRPQSYIEINNFYTTTVYEKGAEVIRMQEKILGKQGFRKGMDKYFELYDGQAVTTDDFVHAMEIANGADLSQFKNTWYEQAGTPELTVHSSYDSQAQKFSLEISQATPATPGQAVKKPFHIPLAIGIVDSQTRKDILATTLQIKKQNEVFVFDGITSKPVLSLLRGFSAPVKIKCNYSDEELLFLLAHDGDSFARWEAGQILILRSVAPMIEAAATGKEMKMPKALLEAYAAILRDEKIDHAFKAFLLSVPSESYLSMQQAAINVEATHKAREFFKKEIAKYNEEIFAKTFKQLNCKEDYSYDQVSVGRRDLKNQCFHYLLSLGKTEYIEQAYQQLIAANNMTDQMAVLFDLTEAPTKERELALAHFYQQWKHETLVMNKWLMAQSSSTISGTVERVKALMKDPVYDGNNPNKVGHLLGVFAKNEMNFHHISGSGYAFIADQVINIDKTNAQISARMAGAFNQWKRYDLKRQALMKKELERIVQTPGISPGVFEITSKALQ